jgi:hypothetical protein
MTDFDFLVKKIRDDYPGYNDKIQGDKVRQLAGLEQDLHQRLNLHPDSCWSYLAFYASFFSDKHLGVRRVPGPDKEWVRSDTSSFGKNMTIDTNELFAHTAALRTIEGLWLSGLGRMAVVKNPEADDYLGVSVSYRGWKPGQVMFEFTAAPPMGQNANLLPGDTLFTVVKHTLWKGARKGKTMASLHADGHVLELHDLSFLVRKSSFPRDDIALMRSYTPLHPNGSNVYFKYAILSDSTFYIRANSFDGFREKIEKVIKDYWKDIMGRPNLIIDVRNNGGGLDDEWQMLFSLVYDKPFVSKGVEWYATTDNIQMYENDLKTGNVQNGEEGIKWMKSLLAEMKKHPGQFVIHPMMGKDDTVKEDTVYRHPSRVGIIINEYNGSAAEQFLLDARESSKVTLFGTTHTAGVLDYSNAVEVDFPSGKYTLRYPMSRSRRLPEHPIDNIGISPDVIIPYPTTAQLFDKLDVWVEYVKDWLEAGVK